MEKTPSIGDNVLWVNNFKLNLSKKKFSHLKGTIQEINDENKTITISCVKHDVPIIIESKDVQILDTVSNFSTLSKEEQVKKMTKIMQCLMSNPSFEATIDNFLEDENE